MMLNTQERQMHMLYVVKTEEFCKKMEQNHKGVLVNYS